LIVLFRILYFKVLWGGDVFTSVVTSLHIVCFSCFRLFLIVFPTRHHEIKKIHAKVLWSLVLTKHVKKYSINEMLNTRFLQRVLLWGIGGIHPNRANPKQAMKSAGWVLLYQHKVLSFCN